MTQTEAASCPSFSAHSSDFDSDSVVPQIAARVIHEQKEEEVVKEGDDFDFSFVPDSSPVVFADDIFYNGQIRPVYPLGLVDYSSLPVVLTSRPLPPRLPLRTLMFQDRDTVNHTTHDLDGVAEGTYCLWTPPCKKTTKRWNIRHLLPRTLTHSNNNKHSLLFPLPSKHNSSAVCRTQIRRLFH